MPSSCLFFLVCNFGCPSLCALGLSEQLLLGFLDHVSGEGEQLAVSDDASHGFCLSCEEVLQHDDALFLGCALVEASPVAAAPEFLCDDVRLLAVPSKERDAVQEGVRIAFTYMVVHGKSVREADCLVVGVASSAGVTKGEVHVLLWVVGERTAREGWECLCGNECE